MPLLPAECASTLVDALNVTQQDNRLSATATVASLDRVAERRKLSVADEIALQDADLRLWMGRRVVLVFIIANAATLTAITALVLLDQANIASKLISSNERIITQQVILGLLGATTVQVGTIAVIIARYLFPSRISQT